MTDIEKKALALVNEVYGSELWTLTSLSHPYNRVVFKALCRAIEQHEAFRREVSEEIMRRWPHGRAPDGFGRFIIAKPDPLVEAWMEAWPNDPLEAAEKETQALRKALAKRGGKIVWENGQ